MASCGIKVEEVRDGFSFEDGNALNLNPGQNNPDCDQLQTTAEDMHDRAPVDQEEAMPIAMLTSLQFAHCFTATIMLHACLFASIIGLRDGWEVNRLAARICFYATKTIVSTLQSI
jgi:hypothetical protein